MPFPTVESTTSTAFASSSTEHNAAYPATVSAGDLLLMVVSAFDGTTITTPTGYTELATAIDSAPVVVRAAVYAKAADGTEGGGSEAIALASAHTACAQVMRISGWAGDVSTDIDISSGGIGSSSTPDPDSVNAGWGDADNLFVAVVGAGDDDAIVTSYPTSYGGGATVASGGGANNGCSIGTAYRSLNGTTDDPGIFNLTSAEAWLAWTVVVAPAGAGGSNPMMNKMMHEGHSANG